MAKRTDILITASKLTGQERNKTYGDPMINLACAGELKEVFRRWNSIALEHDQGRYLSQAEQEAIDLAFTKISRIATGKYHDDNYVDLTAYSAIAGEAAALGQQNQVAAHEPIPEFLKKVPIEVEE